MVQYRKLKSVFNSKIISGTRLEEMFPSNTAQPKKLLFLTN